MAPETPIPSSLASALAAYPARRLGSVQGEAHPEVVQQLLALAESMRGDPGDYDRVGKNMRFFDPIDPRPSEPPVPAARKPKK